jgi:Family of unknown function (DUF6174)
MTSREPILSGGASGSFEGNTAGGLRDAEQRFSARSVVLALAWVIGTVVVVLILLQVFFVQRIPPLSESRLAAAEELWRQTGPAGYDMEIEIGGAQPGSVHIEVRGGEVAAMTRDGRSPAKHTWVYWSVPGRFEELDRELELAADPMHEMQAEAGTRLELRCEFDPKYGFPKQYHRVVYGGGPEVYWHVTSFEAL